MGRLSPETVRPSMRKDLGMRGFGLFHLDKVVDLVLDDHQLILHVPRHCSLLLRIPAAPEKTEKLPLPNFDITDPRLRDALSGRTCETCPGSMPHTENGLMGPLWGLQAKFVPSLSMES